MHRSRARTAVVRREDHNGRAHEAGALERGAHVADPLVEARDHARDLPCLGGGAGEDEDEDEERVEAGTRPRAPATLRRWAPVLPASGVSGMEALNSPS